MISVSGKDWQASLRLQSHCQLFRNARPLQLESGSELERFQLAYETWGKLNAARSNGILLLHGFTADSHAASHASAGGGLSEPGWWEGLIGPGLALDTRHFFIVCPNVLGGCRGSTGPSSQAADGQPYGSRFPDLTTRDMAFAEQQLADSLGVSCWHAVVGCSLGGMRALEWAITAPQRLARLVLLATTAACSYENLAFLIAQINAIEMDPAFAAGNYYDRRLKPLHGLALARSIGMLSFGCEQGWEACFLDESPLSLKIWQRADALAFARRFDANSYLVLARAILNHNVGRGRESVVAALKRIQAATTVIAIRSDHLFPASHQLLMADSVRQSELSWIDSIRGHDGFLSEDQSLNPLLRQALQTPI